MAVRIGANISSLQAQRQLGNAGSSLAKIHERLSSGQRINSASDDAAGLSVSSSLSMDRRIYNQGVRNLNGGISSLSIADGAVRNLATIVMRLQELAEQAANGSNGETQRKSIDDEAQALANEYFRISKSTSFNGVHLLDGSMPQLSLQAGYGQKGALISGLGGAIGTGSLQAAATANSGNFYRAVAIADLNGDGLGDLVTADQQYDGSVSVRMGTGDGGFSQKTDTYSTQAGGYTSAISLADLDEDGILDMVTAGYGSKPATVHMGKGDGTFSTGAGFFGPPGYPIAVSTKDLNGDGILDLIAAGCSISDGSGVTTVQLGIGDGHFSEATSYAAEGGGSYALAISDLNGDGILDMVSAGGAILGVPQGGQANVRLGNGDGSFSSAISYVTGTANTWALALSDLNGDGVQDMVAAGEGGNASVRLGRGNGSFSASISYAAETTKTWALSLGDIDGDGRADLITAGDEAGASSVSIRLGNGDGTFSATRTKYSMQSQVARSLA